MNKMLAALRPRLRAASLLLATAFAAALLRPAAAAAAPVPLPKDIADRVISEAVDAPLQASSWTIRLKVFYTTDVHGWYSARPAAFHAADPKRLVGGMPALAGLVRGYQGPKLLLDAGDWFQGTPEGNHDRGRAAPEFFNALGYDAVVIGNHDFDYGHERLRELAAMIKAPVLGANVYEEKTGKRPAFLKPYVIKEVAGIKVGILGLLTTQMPRLAFAKSIEGLTFRREVQEAAEIVNELRAKGATVVIALTHIGLESSEYAAYEGDRFLAAKVPGIDLILGGHTHIPLRESIKDRTHGTLIMQAGSYLSEAGVATLDIEPETRRVVRSSGELATLWVDQVGEAEDIKRMVAGIRAELGTEIDVAIGTASETLTRNRLGESSLGDWLADCLRAWSRTEIAFHNGGGIRSDLRAGPVTSRDIFAIMPFENRVTTLKLTGAQVRDVLEASVGGTHSLLQMSGIKMRYKASAPRGSRVTSVTVGDRPLEDRWTYSVTAADFLVKGGDGYPFLQGTEKSFQDTLIRDVFLWCARDRSPVRSAPMDRITRE